MFSISACDKGSNLGSDLISDEWINAKGVDSFDFDIDYYKVDSLLLSYGGLPVNYFLGKINDPIFGHSEAAIYTQIRFINTKNFEFLRVPIDSVVLALRYDQTGIYGDTLLPQTVEVYPLLDTLGVNVRYYEGFSANVGNTLLGKLENFVPNLSDSVKVQINSVTNAFGPQLRIPLDTGLFMDIMRNLPDTPFSNVDTFVKVFPGIAIVAKQNASMLSLIPASEQSRITIYYHIDTVQYEFIFNMGTNAAKAPYIKVDHSGTPVQQFVEGLVNGDSVFYIQGLIGPDARLLMPYSTDWDRKFLNYAVIELDVVIQDESDTTHFKPVDLLFVQDLSSGTPKDIRDFEIARSYSSQLANLSDFAAIFGGIPRKIEVDGRKVIRYSFNITAHFQSHRKEKKDLDLLISPIFKTEIAQRVALYGRKHGTQPARLKLIYSE
ncbi:MAG: DUF4270 family protein [Saprospiraceae bacterium]|nr:DUF4270 family protein [Saprospiraceae bacterium]